MTSILLLQTLPRINGYFSFKIYSLGLLKHISLSDFPCISRAATTMDLLWIGTLSWRSTAPFVNFLLLFSLIVSLVKTLLSLLSINRMPSEFQTIVDLSFPAGCWCTFFSKLNAVLFGFRFIMMNRSIVPSHNPTQNAIFAFTWGVQKCTRIFEKTRTRKVLSDTLTISPSCFFFSRTVSRNFFSTFGISFHIPIFDTAYFSSNIRFN